MSARDPFAAVRRALDAELDDPQHGLLARVDPERGARTGKPEVILAEGKDDPTLLAACRAMLDRVPRVVVSRIGEARADSLARQLAVELERPFPGTTCVLARAGTVAPAPGGFVAVFTAGSSDIPVAGEAAVVARELGCRVEIVADVGVAGLHRVVVPLRRVIREGADAIVVVAGMDGALPSVITGLVDVPVIGLPTSVGYGVAAGGQAALHTMLASCAPGMAVVNIDNGVGAGATAAMIARRARQPRD